MICRLVLLRSLPPLCTSFGGALKSSLDITELLGGPDRDLGILLYSLGDFGSSSFSFSELSPTFATPPPAISSCLPSSSDKSSCRSFSRGGGGATSMVIPMDVSVSLLLRLKTEYGGELRRAKENRTFLLPEFFFIFCELIVILS